jgi:deazaflavin-dependent oxidoreductase (nitroreductase family)
MDDDLVRDGRVARLELRGHRSGLPRPVNVGFVERPDGTFVIAARGFETAWARNLEADPRTVVTIGPRSFAATAELLEDDDPRRPVAIRDLILRYGTPSEGLGRGPVFVLTPEAPPQRTGDRDPTG